MAAKSPHPKCPVCRRKHDPRFTTTQDTDERDAILFTTELQNMVISRHDSVLYKCYFVAGADFDQMAGNYAAREREHKLIYEEVKWLARDPEGYFAARRERREKEENRDRKLALFAPSG